MVSTAILILVPFLVLGIEGLRASEKPSPLKQTHGLVSKGNELNISALLADLCLNSTSESSIRDWKACLRDRVRPEAVQPRESKESEPDSFSNSFDFDYYRPITENVNHSPDRNSATSWPIENDYTLDTDKKLDLGTGKSGLTFPSILSSLFAVF